MSDGTYGGIKRSKEVFIGGYDCKGGQLTVEILKKGFESIKRMDEATTEWEMEFARNMNKHAHLIPGDYECYIALYRLYQSSRAPLHPKEYEKLMAIVKSRGIEP